MCFFLFNFQVKIGRSADVTYTILSATISRCHAIINKQEDNTWTITDNKSLNGISVNGKKLEASEPCVLKDGDTVELGVPASPDVPAEFVYRFFSALKVRKERASKKRPSAEDGGQSKRHKRTDCQKSTVPLSSDAGEEKENSQGKEDAETQRTAESTAERAKKEQERLKLAYEEQLRALAQQLQEKEEEKWAITQQLRQEREERQVMEEKQKEQEELVNELDSRQRQLAMEKAASEEEMRRQMEETLREREESLRSQMQQRLGELSSEKSQVEERLQKEMEKAVQEKDKELQERLQGEKERLQKIIKNKELEHKALESQLAESRVENEKARSDSLLTRESVLSEFAETMETELQCAICNELFVKATSLNCSHAFCSLCLRQWLAVKKECPNCRSPVTSQMRSIVMDNYIDRMVEQLSADMKQRRTQMVAERKEAEKKLEEAENTSKAGPSGAAGGRGRSQTRGTAREGRRGRTRGRGRAAGAAAAERPAPAATHTTTTVSVVGGVPFAARDPLAAGAPAAATVAAPSAAPAIEGGAGVPAVGAVITIGSETDIDNLVNDPAVAEAILVSDVESDGLSDSDDGDNLDSSEDLHHERRYLDRFGYEHLFDNATDEDEEEEDYVGGTGAYFGGYGRCFKCGARGHWANGCPN
ncbi:hypothetical protein ACOMHN_047415 [Nucella lapillus]